MMMGDDILIERYFKGELSEIETKAFKDRLKTDEDFKIKVDFEKELFDSYNEELWNFSIDESDEVDELEAFFKGAEAKSFEKTIKEGSDAFKNKKKGKIRPLFFISVAASIALLVGVFRFFNNGSPNSNYGDLYNEYVTQTTLPTFVNRGDNDTEVNLIEAEKSFKNKDYKKALVIFGKSLLQDKNNSAVYMYKAISYIELKDYISAEKILDSLINSDLIDAQKGYWFKSLSLVKQNKLSEAKELLHLIIDKAYYNKEKAQELLEQLN
ncbi:tetratricopeptide repeat protein [uncultured Tenacibaculum sp.]|uniref:tetratricopeptide repeat protein n=1 Tax=uncultured Tenacibaculum sp. TaxID=174713 RepID=UPI00260DAEDA|nr:tetratricopeptide repeat protein [uncultured Tenacibaculum sp.]